MELVTQRRVSANDAPRPRTSAPSSIFEAGQRAKPQRVDHVANIDPDAVTIRRGVPVPEVNHHPRSKWKQLLDRMQPGDMVELPEKVAASLVATGRKAGIKTSWRRLGDGKTGVWKL